MYCDENPNLIETIVLAVIKSENNSHHFTDQQYLLFTHQIIIHVL